jgi:hypothetical protein
MNANCAHTQTIRVTVTSARGCEECLALGMRWVHLRLCTACGHVGCCDQSQGRHATKHFAVTAHPVIRSIEPNEGWYWCYVDEVFLDLELPASADLPL